MSELRLGMIGISPGNGHPYSWSSIFNGYDKVNMESCGFPVIPRYLERQSFPDDAISGARVTHLWTQDLTISNHIAQCTHIDNVVANYNDMVGEIDALLLARDDSQNHLEFVKPFLKAGTPIYIDKPIALNLIDFENIYSYQLFPGQIFSCSAYRFANEIQLAEKSISAIGKVEYVIATVPKDWKKYGVHLVDPILNMLGLYSKKFEIRRTQSGVVNLIEIDWGFMRATLFCMGSISCDIKITLFGNNGSIDILMGDTFSAFKNSLSAFVSGIKSKSEITKKDELRSVVDILERGCFT